MKGRLCAFFLLLVALIHPASAQVEPTDAELEFSAAWLANTSAASSSEDILIAIMFAQQNQPNGASAFLSIPIAGQEHNKLRYSLIAYSCLPRAIAEICEDSDFDTQLIALDQYNLEPYLYSMLRLIGVQNDSAALLALTKGNAAPEMNNYYFEKVGLLRSRLATAGYPRLQMNGAAEGLAGAGTAYALYSEVMRVCTDRSKTSDEWKAQCIMLGGRLEHEGQTAMQNVFGFAIQRDSLGTSTADEEARASVLSRRDKFNAIRDRGSRELVWWNDASLKTDALYRSIIELGEIQAVIQELER